MFSTLTSFIHDTLLDVRFVCALIETSNLTKQCQNVNEVSCCHGKLFVMPSKRNLLEPAFTLYTVTWFELCNGFALNEIF